MLTAKIVSERWIAGVPLLLLLLLRGYPPTPYCKAPPTSFPTNFYPFPAYIYIYTGKAYNDTLCLSIYSVEKDINKRVDGVDNNPSGYYCGGVYIHFIPACLGSILLPSSV